MATRRLKSFSFGPPVMVTVTVTTPEAGGESTMVAVVKEVLVTIHKDLLVIVDPRVHQVIKDLRHLQETKE